jgi:hypothetical protein
MGGTQLRALATVGGEPPKPTRIKAASLLSFICVGFVLLLLCMQLLRPTLSKLPVGDSYWASGDAVRRGTNPYAAPDTHISHFKMVGNERVVVDLNLNPPCVLPLFQALSHIPPKRFLLVWTILSGALLYGTVALLIWHRPDMQKRQIFWLLLSAPVFDTFLACQLYFALFFLAALAWVLMERDHELAAAISIGLLVAIKPTAVFWPLFLYVRGNKRLALRSLTTALMVSAVPLFLYGPQIYRDWQEALTGDLHWLFITDIAIPAFFARFGLHSLGLVLALILAILLAWMIWKTRPSFTATSGIALCAAILCAPLGWVAYSLMVAPYFVSRRWNAPSNVAALLLTIPTGVDMHLFASGKGSLVILSRLIYFAAIWIILLVFLSRDFRMTDGAPRLMGDDVAANPPSV